MNWGSWCRPVTRILHFPPLYTLIIMIIIIHFYTQNPFCSLYKGRVHTNLINVTQSWAGSGNCPWVMKVLTWGSTSEPLSPPVMIFLVHSNWDTRLPRKCYHALEIPQAAEEFALYCGLLRLVLVSEGCMSRADVQFSCHATWVAWALSWLANSKLGVHVMVHSVVASV